MSGPVHAELVKLLTTRAARWIVVLEVALVAAALSGAAVSGSFPAAVLATDAGRRGLLEHGGLTALLTLVLGVTVSANEFRHGTVVDTFLTVPRRTRVVLAKLAAGAVAGLIAGALNAAAALVTTIVWYADRRVSLEIGTPLVRSLVGVTAWHLLYAVVGVALGFLLRSPAAAVVAAIVWVTLAETAIAGFAVRLGRWLPGTAARALGGDPGEGLLPQAAAGIVLLGWALALGVIAVVITERRDVT